MAVKYDKDTDYQAKINDAVEKGDYKSAAKYEQQRNQKIKDTGSSYAATNKYSQYLSNMTPTTTVNKVTTPSINISGSPKSWVSSPSAPQSTSQYTSKYTGDKYASIRNYANQLNGGYQQAIEEAVGRGDFVTAAIAEQLRNEKLLYTNNGTYAPTYLYQSYLQPDKAEDWLAEYENQQPETPEKDPRIDELLNQILNRDDFSYDALSDPLYQQYAKMYQREGDRAMKETMAEAAAGAGGMNSYAITAAQQAANNYSAQLNDMIPQLYQLAYDMYLADKESKIQDLGLLQNADAMQYERYRDAMDDYRNDKNFAYSLYQDDVANGQWQQQFNYNKAIDERDFAYNDLWTNKQWDYNVGRDEISDSRYNQEQARAELWNLIDMGVTTISPDLIEKSGLNQDDINRAIAARQLEALTGKSSGGSSRKSTGKTKDEDDEPKLGDSGDTSWIKGMNDLGLGLVYSPELLVELDGAGAIYEEDGKLNWAYGWNAQNYQTKLSLAKTTNSLSLPIFK